MTFVAQFCFADSRDILPIAPPGDVMLLFFRDEEAFNGRGTRFSTDRATEVVTQWA